VYRIVDADGRSPRDGRFIENIGTYNPTKATDNFKVDLERAKHWISKGAQPSDTVRSFLKKAEKAAKLAQKKPSTQTAATAKRPTQATGN